MRWKKHKPVAVLREELTCPGCGYSLRGLPGDVATCPECGVRCDLAKLMMREWIGPWYRAPGFNRVLFPVAWPGFGWWVLLFVWLYETQAFGRPPILTLLLAAVLVAGWSWSMWRLRLFMPRWEAVVLALFAHALLLGYLAGLIGVIAFVLQAIKTRSVALAAPMVAFFAGLMLLCRRGERFIAERCIRRYLIDQAAA